jgi:hypothetical protein
MVRNRTVRAINQCDDLCDERREPAMASPSLDDGYKWFFEGLLRTEDWAKLLGAAERKLTRLYALLEIASKRIARLEEENCLLREPAVPLRLVDEAPAPAAHGRS